ncbi:MAG TPA: hypothetical protein PLE33_02700 [Candidatus Cloacimonas sp.]|nr:hypothetical protein [Candidatus Cloacimonas sp.]
MTPVSFPYRDTGMIPESHPQHIPKKQELITGMLTSSSITIIVLLGY